MQALDATGTVRSDATKKKSIHDEAALARRRFARQQVLFLTRGWSAATGKRWTLSVAPLLVVATAASISSAGPEVWAPMPLPLFILAAFIGPLAFLAPAGIFLLWSKQLLNGEARVPHRSLWALAVLGALNFWYFLSVWTEGVLRYGHDYVLTVAIVNAGFVATLGGRAVRSYRRPTFASSLFFHSLLFLWLVWYAFPYLGEGP